MCSPTRATVLTGRNNFRDCVDYVYDCSDPTECTPDFEFAPGGTWTVADAVREADRGYTSMFSGKWHLGSFYNDSADLGGIWSSPISHGFDHMNATIEVAPTRTTNCNCNAEWSATCEYGHYHKPAHCNGGPSPGGPTIPHVSQRALLCVDGPSNKARPCLQGCCFNYWSESDESPHGVVNITWPTPPDDTLYLSDSFDRFLTKQGGSPFLAQISFHNCHVPCVALQSLAAQPAPNDSSRDLAASSAVTDRGRTAPPARRASCQRMVFRLQRKSWTTMRAWLSLMLRLGASCRASMLMATARTRVRGAALLRSSHTAHAPVSFAVTMFAMDNGPEMNCPPLGICKGSEHRPREGPGSAGPLRGRKRDIWEGGHRVPGLVSWPAVVSGNHESWDTVVTQDFLATVMDVLHVDRPAEQRDWGFDGVSMMPLLKGEPVPERGIGWMFMTANASATEGYGYRQGKWKLVVGSKSCRQATCRKPQLYDLSVEYVRARCVLRPFGACLTLEHVCSLCSIGERNDLAASHADVLASITANFTAWHASVMHSRTAESQCRPKTDDLPLN